MAERVQFRNIDDIVKKPLELQQPAWRIVADHELLALRMNHLRSVREGGTARILCGPVDGPVYGDEFREAVRFAVEERRATVRVITPPILFLDENGENVFLSLHRQHHIDLSHRARVFEDYDFHVVDSETAKAYLVAEADIHPLAGEPHRRRAADFRDIEPTSLRGHVDYLVNYFDLTAEGIAYHRRTRNPDFTHLPIVATQREFEQMMTIVDGYRHLDRLGTATLSRLIQQARAQN